MAGFSLAPHLEAGEVRRKQTEARHARFIQSWANDERAMGLAVQSEISGATDYSHAPTVLAMAVAGVPLNDTQTQLAVAQGISMARQRMGNLLGSAAVANAEGTPPIAPNDSTQNEEWNFRANPGAFATEAMQWWGRSPGEAVGAGRFSPLSHDHALGRAARGTSRVFLLAFDAAVDAVSDRVWRAGVEAYSQASNPVEWIDEFSDEYFGGLVGGSENDVIGDKPFWKMLTEYTEDNRVNLSTGFVANSEVTDEYAQMSTNAAMDSGQYMAEQQALYDEDPKAWEAQATHATPYSQGLNYEAARSRNLFQNINTEGQEELGRPITQEYETQAEGFVKPIRFGMNAPVDGRPHISKISGGRIISAYVAEPGSTEAHWVSGIGDFSKQIGMDPALLAAAPGKVVASGRLIGATRTGAARVASGAADAATDAARIADAGVVTKAVREAPSAFDRGAIVGLKENLGRGLDMEPQELGDLVKAVREAPTEAEAIVLTNRARTTVESGKANRYLTGSQAQPTVTALAEATTMKQVSAIISGVKGRVPASLRTNLRNATTEAEVIDILLPVVDSGLKLRGNMRRSATLGTYSSITDYLGIGSMGGGRDDLALLADMGAGPWNMVNKASEVLLDTMYQAGIAGGREAGPLAGLNMRPRFRAQYGNIWVGRMLNDASNAGLHSDDMDAAYVKGENLARNGGLDTDDVLIQTNKGNVYRGKSVEDAKAAMADAGVKGEKTKKMLVMDDVMAEMGLLGNGDDAGLFNSVKKIMDGVGMQMREEGIDEAFIKQATNLYARGQDDSLYFVNAVGDSVNYPGTGFSTLIDGELAFMPGPQLLNEFHKGVVNVPDPRILRRALAEGHAPGRLMNTLTTEKAFAGVRPKNLNFGSKNLQDRGLIRFQRNYLNQVWKPAKLLRLGYPLKIVMGDEMARMIASGYDALYNSPLSYIATVIGRKGKLDVLGNEMAVAREMKEVVSLKGNSFGEVGMMRSDSWDVAVRGSDEYIDGLATEITQLADDPIVGRLFGATDEAADAATDAVTDAAVFDEMRNMAAKLAQENPEDVYKWARFREAAERKRDGVPGASTGFKREDLAEWNRMKEQARAKLEGRRSGPAPITEPLEAKVVPKTSDEWDAIGPDEYVTVYHATDAAYADDFVHEGVTAVNKRVPDTPNLEAGTAGPGLYVSGDPSLVGAYGGLGGGTGGRRVLEIRVKKKDISSPKELAGGSAHKGLLSDRQGALIAGDIPAENIRLMGRTAGAADAGEDSIARVAEWLMTDPEGQKLFQNYVDAVNRVNPAIGDDFAAGGAALKNYLEGVNARAHLKTGGDYVYVDPNTGNVMSSADDIIGVKGEGEWANLEDGFTITRRGNDDLLESFATGTWDDVAMTGLNRTSYNQIMQKLRTRLDEQGDNFPQGVKTASRDLSTQVDPGMYKRVVGRLMDWVVAKPAENFTRSPTYTQAYWKTIGTYMNDLTDEAADAMRAAAKKTKATKWLDEGARDAAPGNKTISSLEDIDLYAKSVAAEQVIDLLFDFAKRKNSLDALNLIFPFGDAFIEAFSSYGRIFANNPQLYRRPMKALQEMKNNNLTEWGDEEINSETEGFFYVNDYGQEVFALPIGGLQEWMGTPPSQFEIDVSSLNMIANQFYPGFGHVVTIPAAATLPDDPAWQGLKDFIAPFGMGDDLLEETLKHSPLGVSPTLNKFLTAWHKGSFVDGSDRLFEQTRHWMLREYIASGELQEKYGIEAHEVLSNKDLNEEVQQEITRRAQGLYLIRGILAFASPASPGAPKLFVDMDDPAAFEKLAMQDASRTFWDIYNTTAEGDYEEATYQFSEKYGYDPAAFLISSYEEGFERGLTEEAYNVEKRFPEVYDQLPNTAYFLAPDNPEDPFYYKAWVESFESGARELRTTEEIADDYIYRAAALEYRTQLAKVTEKVESGLIDMPMVRNDDGTESPMDVEEFLDIAGNAIETEIFNQFPAYQSQEGAFSKQAKMDNIAELRSWSNYSRVSDTPTGRALEEFFSFWDEAKASQVNAGVGSGDPNLIPFDRTNAKPVTAAGNVSTTWLVRNTVNKALIAKAEEIAKRPGSGNFGQVWDRLIKETVYDYEGAVADGAEKETESSSIEQLIESLME